MTPEHIRRARQGYFANISYVDELGEILDVLERTRQDAIVVFLSDHGEMLGEHRLWFKMNFFEQSARVPMMIAAPGMAPGRVDTPVSTVDVLPTLCELAGLPLAEYFRDVKNQDVLLFIDNIFRFTQAGFQVFGSAWPYAVYQ